ncbi:hypothetical protein ACROYT_G003020 [Oculina patagonica]
MMNGSRLNGSQEYLQITSQDIVFATLYSFMVFFGVVGNGIVITIVQKTPSMHTTTNYLLLNLAVADLLTLLLCPGVYDFALNHFRINPALGDIVCKLFAGNAIVCITFDASVLTLCVIAVERYVAIVKPFKSSRWNISSRKMGIVIALIWLMAFILSFPDSLWTEYSRDDDLASSRYPCIRPWTLDHESTVKVYIVTHCIILIVLPSVLISFCYLSILKVLKWDLADPAVDEADKNNMRRLLKLLVSLAVAFCILCLPFASFFLYVAALEKTQIEQDFASLFLAHRIVRVLIFFNSFINPLLYAAQSTNYRKALQALCCRTIGANTEREAINLANRNMITGNGEKV